MNSTKTIQERLARLRDAMKDFRVDAFIITGSDPHLSEIPSSRWRTREWISGFTGSAGIIVVTKKKAGLWTDSRYWIQAANELKGNDFQLYKEGEENILSPIEWISKTIPKGSRISLDGRTFSARMSSEWRFFLNEASFVLITEGDLIEDAWINRPLLPNGRIVELTLQESGETRKAKIQRLMNRLEAVGASGWIGVNLDSQAWILNVRGTDIPYTPVVYGYLFLSQEKSLWFTDEDKISEEIKQNLRDDGIEIYPYQNFEKALRSLDKNNRILADFSCLTQAVLDCLPEEIDLIERLDPVLYMKSLKNVTEKRKTVQAMEKDGQALVRFLFKLESRIEKGEIISEVEAAKMLLDIRKSLPGFLEESFATISAFGPNGALCHYNPEEKTALKLGKEEGLYLFDSGGQWEEGTTDVTRTIVFGLPQTSWIKDYTLILKAHLALFLTGFPSGTRGYQLDSLTRSVLWNHGIDYGHGTGHGVGYRLSVHEGPQILNKNPRDVVMEPGMIVSNEPGLYREGCYGIRIENLMICRKHRETEFGSFLDFENLTLCPYDRRLIDKSRLNRAEIQWVDAYHREVFQRLSPCLDADERIWLKSKINPL